jgi:hypothetical protein|uniref:Uncharacterized protein n=1 Tax=uncultured marine thaumarchaeote AD1000_39_D02 TaxID=1455912 RepID=A0A075FW14_9ARCH|nr:hypothetical protein [uncultured marine thaumarchaeote AD1000_39_D02]
MYQLLSILSVLIIISTIPIVSSEVMRGEFTVPNWVKNTAGWWAEDQIPDSAFLQGIQYLINEGIMIVEISAEIDSEAAEEVPGWVKKTAGWWAEDQIHDTTFVSGIEYLISKGIIIVEQEVEVVEDPVEEVVEIKDFYMQVNGGTCSYCVSWAYVGDEYHFQIETYDERHGKYIDGVKITAKIISKGGELRQNLGQVATEDGIYKNSITIPSMDWYAGNILSVTGEYFGVEKTIEKEFEVFRGQGVIRSGSSGAGAGDCALVAPVSVNNNNEGETNPHGITFSSSGQKMFMVGNKDTVFEYDLSSPFGSDATGADAQTSGMTPSSNAYCIDNVSTPSTKSLSHVTGMGNPTGIVFDPSGTKMFLVDKHPDKVFQFTVNVPWRADAVNATAGDADHCYCNPESFSITDQEKVAEGITFDPSGTKMFIVGSEGTNKGEVNTYNLAEPYRVTSASHADVYTMSFTDANPSGIVFDTSGTKMFISDAGTDTVREYKLTIPYLLSSNSTGDADTPSLSMSAVGNTVRDIWFDASGTKLFVLEQGGKDVTVYELTTPFTLSSATIVS